MVQIPLVAKGAWKDEEILDVPSLWEMCLVFDMKTISNKNEENTLQVSVTLWESKITVEG